MIKPLMLVWVMVPLILAVLNAPLDAEAQPAGKVYTVGTLSIGFPNPAQDWWQPFLEAMRERGYIEGRNFIEKRSTADGRPERLAGLAAELVRAKVDIIVATSGGGNASGATGYVHDSHRDDISPGSGRPGFGRQPGAPGRQCDRLDA
jgi:hypothetical protein